jgi:hypothetical protein
MTAARAVWVRAGRRARSIAVLLPIGADLRLVPQVRLMTFHVDPEIALLPARRLASGHAQVIGDAIRGGR